MAVIGTDQITIIDLTDGYSVFLTPESYAFPAGTTHAKAGNIVLSVTALKGADSTPVTVGTITHGSGTAELGKFTVTVTDNGTANPKITVAIGASNTVSAPGYFEIPCNVGDGITIVKRFVYSLAFTGQGGSAGVSPRNIILGMEGVTIPTNAAGATSSAATITIPWGSYQGTTRVAGTVAATTLPTGITVSSNTGATTSADGSLVLSVANASTLGGNSSGIITLTFTVSGQSFVRYFSWAKAIKGSDGEDGDDGADAVILAVTSSNGTIFKSTAVVTTLTASVFKGGVQIPYANLAATFGTGAAIKWYKDGSSTSTSTGETVVINGTLVDHKAVYEARLEV